MQKLGGIYCNDQNEKQDKDSAIECFKMAVELVKGDSNKQKIALTLQQLLIQCNREFEFNPYVKYLPEANQGNEDQEFE